MPIFGDRNGPTFEGWTLLSALAAKTYRLRIGLLVTSNRFRPPAMLAKIAATVDIVSQGRLDFGIGAGSRPGLPLARREYEAHGLPFHDFSHSVDSLAEALTVIRRLWTETEPFDVAGPHVRLTGAFGNPKPMQRPHPPILIGGRSARLLRVVAEHADLWNVPGDDLDDAIARSVLLDRYCAVIPPLSPGRCTYRCPTTDPTSPAMRSTAPSPPASRTSCSGWRTLTRTASLRGSPTNSSTPQEREPRGTSVCLSTLRSNGSRRARASAESGARYGRAVGRDRH
jgi:alkanesulfonate monooxygenase SsuD/methylene tetrahydromethanopterin reductase-like flavin-dependent oxidoreductase (luciferase family)